MRFSINGWPPLASHFLCFFLGTILVHHVSGAQKIFSYKLSKGEFMLRSYPELDRKLRTKKGKHISKFFLVRKNNKGKSCRIHSKSLHRYWGSPFIMIQKQKELNDILDKLYQKNGIETISVKHGKNLSLCKAQERVIYGG